VSAALAGALSRAWPAPAKINLFLHVTGRREDGMHCLQTIFQLLDYGDLLDFRVREDGQLRALSGLPGLAPERDLGLRAAALLQASSGTRMGADIFTRKRLPAGGGLGGGSSNAATVLVALNCLWGTGATTAELAAVGLALGADVPVFVHGRTAWAEGVGECLQPCAPDRRWFLVVAPGVSVSTAAVFGSAQLTAESPRIKIQAFSLASARNDCEPVTRAMYPEVARAMDWLAARAPCRMTGSGGCVFAAFAARAEAAAILAELPAPWRGFVAQGLGRSPLRGRLLRALRGNGCGGGGREGVPGERAGV